MLYEPHIHPWSNEHISALAILHNHTFLFQVHGNFCFLDFILYINSALSVQIDFNLFYFWSSLEKCNPPTKTLWWWIWESNTMKRRTLRLCKPKPTNIKPRTKVTWGAALFESDIARKDSNQPHPSSNSAPKDNYEHKKCKDQLGLFPPTSISTRYHHSRSNPYPSQQI